MRTNRGLTFLVGFKALLLAGALVGSAATPAPGPPLPFLSPMFGDNMVLQRGKTNAFWGWTKPGEAIRVEVGGHTATAVAGSDGRWEARVEPPPAGGPYLVKIEGPQRVELKDVAVGDVWLCGGQSNMYLGLGQARDGAEEVKRADHPDLRLFMVQQQVAYSAAAVLRGTWRKCTPQTVAEGGAGGFSAVAYYFACKLQAELQVPVGLIQDCVGGTPAESWMSPETLRTMESFASPLAEIERLRAKGGPLPSTRVIPTIFIRKTRKRSVNASPFALWRRNLAGRFPMRARPANRPSPFRAPCESISPTRTAG